MIKQFLTIFILSVLMVNCNNPAKRTDQQVNEKSDTVKKSETDSTTSHKLNCNNGYAIVSYYSSIPNEKGITDLLYIEVTKDGKVEKYNMKPAMSASGAKYESTIGKYSFWEHQGEFTFRQDEEEICICKEK